MISSFLSHYFSLFISLHILLLTIPCLNCLPNGVNYDIIDVVSIDNDRSSPVSSSSLPSSPALSSNCSSFYCNASASCIPFTWRCDGEIDCYYGEDESNCGASRCPADVYYRCSDTGHCISSGWRCDGYPDCFNGEDEVNCQEMTCGSSANYFKCKSTGKCIPVIDVCDSVPDCEDGEDETGASCAQYCTVKYDRYLCGTTIDRRNQETPVSVKQDKLNATSNVCIWNFYLCDGINDCPDGSDESYGNCARG